MLKSKTQSYFSTMVVTLATLGLILQACGKAKPLSSNPNARSQQSKQAPASTTTDASVKAAVTPTTDQTLQLANELNLTSLGLDIKIRNVSKTAIQNNQMQATVGLTINNEDVTTTLTNTLPDAGIQGLQYSQQIAVPTQTLPYDIEAKGYVDFQNPDVYYALITMTKNGDTSPAVEFAVVISTSATYKSGALVLEPSTTSGTATNTDDSFIATLQGLTAANTVLNVGSQAFDAAPELKFNIGSDPVDVKITQVAQPVVTNNTKVDNDIILNINSNPVEIKTDNDVTDPKNPKASAIPTYPSTLGYDIAATSIFDQTSGNLYVLMTLSKTGVAPSTTTARGLVFVLGNSNPALSKGILMLDSATPSTADNFIKNVLAKYPATTPAPTTAAPAAPTAPAATPAAVTTAPTTTTPAPVPTAAPAPQAAAAQPAPTAATDKSAVATKPAPAAPAQPVAPTKQPAPAPAPDKQPAPAPTPVANDKQPAPAPDASGKTPAPSVTPPAPAAPTVALPAVTPAASLSGTNDYSKTGHPVWNWIRSWWRPSQWSKSSTTVTTPPNVLVPPAAPTVQAPAAPADNSQAPTVLPDPAAN